MAGRLRFNNMVAKNYIGKKFNRLTVVCEVERTTKNRKFLCVCDCGNKINVEAHSFVGGKTKSCGCLKKESNAAVGKLNRKYSIDFIAAKSKTYKSWISMKYRCSSPTKKNYSGRGIRVCERWLNSFENFIFDMGERPKGMTLDRFPNQNGNYEPLNCRWATPIQQSNNLRSNRVIIFNGVKMNLSEWARNRGIKMTTLKERINRGWSVERSLGYV